VSSGGCVALLSGGASDKESAFIEATPDGTSVFFVTAERLSRQDTDTAYDIYDARECTTGSPCLSAPPSPPLPCAETQACRPAEPTKPLPGGPAGTATFKGPGNTISQPPPAQARHGVEAKRIVKRSLTRAQKLARALQGCRKRYHHVRRKREGCERAARRRYRKSGGHQSGSAKPRTAVRSKGSGR
jgi:hypothetical protein